MLKCQPEPVNLQPNLKLVGEAFEEDRFLDRRVDYGKQQGRDFDLKFIGEIINDIFD
jgi:hypothetical protein